MYTIDCMFTCFALSILLLLGMDAKCVLLPKYRECPSNNDEPIFAHVIHSMLRSFPSPAFLSPARHETGPSFFFSSGAAPGDVRKFKVCNSSGGNISSWDHLKIGLWRQVHLLLGMYHVMCPLHEFSPFCA